MWWCGAGLLAGAVLAATPVMAVEVPVRQPGRGDGAAEDRGGLLPDPSAVAAHYTAVRYGDVAVYDLTHPNP